MSVTDKCNLACAYCKPRPVPKLRHEDVMSIEQLVEVVEAFRTLGVDKVRVTGGEPLVRHGVVEFVRQVAALGCNTVMTTNGTLLAGYAGALPAYTRRSAGERSSFVTLTFAWVAV